MVFKFPIPPGYNEEPVWMGNCFRIGSNTISVLKYTECDDGWDAKLTDFHEKEAEEGNHYIDRASRIHACNELKKIEQTNRAVILEIGSSSGYLLEEIKKSFPESFLIGSDCIPEPLERMAQHRPDIPLIQFDLVNCPLPNNCVDVIIALNVLEHIKDDDIAIKQIHRILKPGGYAIIEVPANQDLYDFYDEQLKHFRRYDLNDLQNKALKINFGVIHASHLGFLVYPMFRLVKLRNKRDNLKTEAQKISIMKKHIQLGGPVANSLLFIIMVGELYFGKIFRYPFGIRCVITLKKETE